MQITAIIVAAGRGTRAGDSRPKQFRPLNGRPVLDHTLGAFSRHPKISDIVIVHHRDDVAILSEFVPATVQLVAGGDSRADSVAAGLSAVPAGTTHVLIHDAARPCVTLAIIDRVIDALETHAAAAPAIPVTDALWTGSASMVSGTHPRDGLWRAQTPQGFELPAIVDAHARADVSAADDVELARAIGIPVAIVPGDEDNIKITAPGDFDRAARILERRMDIRTGTGFDVHRFGDGDHVVLCGVRIAHARGLRGHSDADVAMHALTDAIYGALAQGDIGRHFPPTDPQWKGAQSHIFLTHAAALAREKGFQISNVDVTLICEEPKITPHAPAMISRLAEIIGIGPDRVSVKATTTERLGFPGRKEGIAAQAVVTLINA